MMSSCFEYAFSNTSRAVSNCSPSVYDLTCFNVSTIDELFSYLNLIRSGTGMSETKSLNSITHDIYRRNLSIPFPSNFFYGNICQTIWTGVGFKNSCHSKIESNKHVM